MLILDNYDSFTFNLFHILEPLVDQIVVRRNDEIEISEVEQFDQIVLSPGPGLPREAGIMPQLLRVYHSSKPILGVCLGMQAIAEHFDTPLINMPAVRHGRIRSITFENAHPLFTGVSEPMTVGLYHSWAVDHGQLSTELEALAFSEEGWLMAMAHKQLPIAGIQFHPESIMTTQGGQILTNWLRSVT